MPIFYTPKPRQFQYKPRFYDPEKERWEALKAKYALEKELEERRKESQGQGHTPQSLRDSSPNLGEQQEDVMLRDSSLGEQHDGNGDVDLEYFQRRVREIEREEKHKGLTWKDMFRKREMPKFHYTPRFSEGVPETGGSDVAPNAGTGEHIAEFKKRNVKIKRRFDVTDPDYMKPMPAGRIMLYALLVCMLLYWVLF